MNQTLQLLAFGALTLLLFAAPGHAQTLGEVSTATGISNTLAGSGLGASGTTVQKARTAVQGATSSSGSAWASATAGTGGGTGNGNGWATATRTSAGGGSGSWVAASSASRGGMPQGNGWARRSETRSAARRRG